MPQRPCWYQRYRRYCCATVRNALLIWIVLFAATFVKVHDPVFARISIEADKSARTATITFDGIVDFNVEPIKNPITGEPMQVSVSMPAGFEYDRAQFASGNVRTTGSPIRLDWSGRHAHLAEVNMTGLGVIHRRA